MIRDYKCKGAYLESRAMRLEGVPADSVRALLPRLSSAFEKMAQKSNGRWHADDVLRFIEARDMQLWLVIDGITIKAVVLTEIIRYPRRTALRFVACVGIGWREWAHLRSGIMEWGKANGCDLFEALAPRKWRHFFTEFREYHVLMECG